ncbi:MAG: DUF262 domain-containing protein [Chloroflexota bacterium]|nr:DUF262 domain-containing protein [Chloroflexota bacterium]
MTEISELMYNINKLDLVLPEFQREYVWSKSQAKQLLISLFHDFPTGSLLFWKTSEPPAVKNTTIPPEKIGSTLVILDGQQRLTTLYLFTQNKIPPYYRKEEIRRDPRNLYFNLASGEFQYYQVTRMQNDPTWVAVTDCFAGFIDPVNIATQKTNDGQQLGELIKHYFENLNKLRGIVKRTYPIQLVPATANIDDAIDVFDLVNSQGTPLSKADLALAHITGKWPQARQIMKNKIIELGKKNFNFSLTFMVRCLTSVVMESALFENIHDTPPDKLQQGWDLLTEVLDYLTSMLAGHANIHSTGDFNTTNVLVPAVFYLSQHDVRFNNDQTMRSFIHWLYASSIWSRYSGQTDQRLDHDMAIIKRSDSPWQDLINAIIDHRGRIEVKPSDLEGRATRHPLYRMTYILSKSYGALDWFNGIPLDLPPDNSYAIHSHHIFPTSLLYSERGGYTSRNHLHKKIVNEIANRAFLTGTSNIKLGNKEPAKYLPEVARKYPGALEKQFIPTDPALWELDRYEDFLASRRALIAKAINERMNELVTNFTPEIQTLVDMLTGESAVLEYKSSMRWDMRRQQVNKGLEKIIAKTIAGFLNSEGGTLLIGVADDCTVLGIEYDLQTIGGKDRDGYEQKLQQVLTNTLGVEHSQYWHVSFEESDGKTICIVHVDPSPEPIYLTYKGTKEFYKRVGNTTRPLNMEAAHDYIDMRWVV